MTPHAQPRKGEGRKVAALWREGVQVLATASSCSFQQSQAGGPKQPSKTTLSMMPSIPPASLCPDHHRCCCPLVGSTCFQSNAGSKSHEHFCARLKYRTLPLGKFRLSATKRLAASVLPGVQGLQLASSLQDTYLSACHRPQSCAAKRLGPRHSAICSAVEQDRHFF